jgi:hypothetical protein
MGGEQVLPEPLPQVEVSGLPTGQDRMICGTSAVTGSGGDRSAKDPKWMKSNVGGPAVGETPDRDSAKTERSRRIKRRRGATWICWQREESGPRLRQGRKRIIMMAILVIVALATVYVVVGRYASSRGISVGFGP